MRRFCASSFAVLLPHADPRLYSLSSLLELLHILMIMPLYYRHSLSYIIIISPQQNFVEHIGDYITDICYLACRHRVKLEAAFINAGLSVEIIEGIASALYPDIKVKSTAMPLVMKAEMMHRLPFSGRGRGWGI